ncbi:MAG: hypothetical protein K2J78_08850 [Muribaculaceae bacterium]|nr:hypothetical protein [Muribaculaceae bacterium]
MGFLDFLSGFGSNNTNNQSYSNNEYDDDDYDYADDDNYDAEYDQFMYESSHITHGIYAYEDTHEEWEWEVGIVNYPHRGFDPWKTIENRMDSYDDEGTEEYLKNYFRKSGKDIVYYCAMAYFYLRKTYGYQPNFEDIQRAKSHIDNAANNCNNDSIWQSLVDHLKEQIYPVYSAFKEEKRLREDFKKEWADLVYRIHYNNMDMYVPQMRNLAQKIRQQLSSSRGSKEFLFSVDSDLSTWVDKYNKAKAEDLIQNNNLDEAVKVATQISDKGIKATLFTRITSIKLQNGELDEAAKIATQISDSGIQTLISARIAVIKLTELVNDSASESDIRRQLFVVEDVLRRASSLVKDKDSVQALQKEVQGIVDNAKNYMNGQTMDSITVETPNPIDRQTSISNASSSNIVSDNEAEFIEELKACLEDGPITDKHRRLLDRLRKSLGISEVRAKELEVICQPQTLTAEEQEYADEVKACLEDGGEITPKERRLLNRIAKSLGLSLDRAIQIERLIGR